MSRHRPLAPGPGLVVRLLIAGTAAHFSAAAAIAQGLPASAATFPSPEPLDSLVAAFQQEFQVPGVVVGFTGPAGHRIHPYGVASAEAGGELDGHTRFEIGSVTKVLTGLLLAELANRGVVHLDDPIDAHLPAAVASPPSEGGPITLRHLATHTSGLPRLPTNLMPADLADPYAGYDVDRLYAFLEGHRPAAAPGTRYVYSNLGVGLLGHLLGLAAAASYGEILRDLVLEPLGLSDTYLPAKDGSATEAADPALAEGHAGGKPVSYWRFDVLAGAGGLRSSARDMLRLLRAQLDPDGSPLADAIRIAQDARQSVRDGPDIALGWHVAAPPDVGPLYWHLGGTGGFRSFVAFLPERGLGFVVLANGAAPLQAVDRLAGQILTLATGGDPEE